jgi:hypothetical protein
MVTLPFKLNDLNTVLFVLALASAIESSLGAWLALKHLLGGEFQFWEDTGDDLLCSPELL